MRTSASRPDRSRDRWGPVVTGALLRMLDSLDDAVATQCAVELRDRGVVVAPTATAAPTPHHALVACGQVAAAVEVALRASGWATRTDTTADPPRRSGPLVTVTATGRHSPSAKDLARHRIGRATRTGATPDRAQVAAIARAARRPACWLWLVNGPSRDGVPAWHSPGSVPVDTHGLDLPWRREPVLAVVTASDGATEAVLAGRVTYRTQIEAAMWGTRTTPYDAPFDAAPARRPTEEASTTHALVHLHR